MRGIHEQPGPPPVPTEREPPFGHRVIALYRPYLNNSYDAAALTRHDAVTDVRGAAAFPLRPADEPPETVDR